MWLPETAKAAAGRPRAATLGDHIEREAEPGWLLLALDDQGNSVTVTVMTSIDDRSVLGIRFLRAAVVAVLEHGPGKWL